jgi:hypothetical protein
VCHPFSGDPVGNVEKIKRICRQLVDQGALPIAPQLCLPAFIDEATERELALDLCLEFVGLCDEVGVFDESVTSGMGREIDRANLYRIPIKSRKEAKP